MGASIGAALVGLTVLLAAADASAQAYPSKPVSLVIAFPPGGASDVLSRTVGKKLEQILGQPFIMDNRPGAGGNVAAEAAAKAPPDGHTVLMANNSILATNAALYKTIGFNPERDFVPISLVGSQANILVVNPAVPANSMAELIAFAKSNPGKLKYASTGHGTAAHLAAELFKAEAKVDIVHVPFTGAAPALKELFAGNVQLMFGTASGVVPHIQSGKLRALAVTPIRRTAVFPDLATIDELGIKGFDATTWHGLVAPAKTPREIVVRLHGATVEALNDPAVRKSLTDLGVDIVGNSPEEFSAYIKAEIPKWTAIVKASGAKLD